MLKHLGILGLCVLGWLAVVGWMAVGDWWWYRTSEEVEGVVLRSEWKTKDGTYYTVRYATPQYEGEFVEHSNAEFWIERDPGEPIPVRYQPNVRNDAIIGTWRNVFGDTITVFIYGGMMVLAAALNALFWSRRAT